jgi:hypothetical protein
MGQSLPTGDALKDPPRFGSYPSTPVEDATRRIRRARKGVAGPVDS